MTSYSSSDTDDSAFLRFDTSAKAANAPSRRSPSPSSDGSIAPARASIDSGGDDDEHEERQVSRGTVAAASLANLARGGRSGAILAAAASSASPTTSPTGSYAGDITMEDMDHSAGAAHGEDLGGMDPQDFDWNENDDARTGLDSAGTTSEGEKEEEEDDDEEQRQQWEAADKGKGRAVDPARSKASSRRDKTRSFIQSIQPETDPARALKNFKEGLLPIEKKFRTLTSKNGGIGILLLAHPRYTEPRPKSEDGVIKRKNGVGYVKALASSEFDKAKRRKIPAKSLTFGSRGIPLVLSSTAPANTDTTQLFRTIKSLFATYVEQEHEKEKAQNAAGMKTLRAQLAKAEQENEANKALIRQLQAQQGGGEMAHKVQGDGEQGPEAEEDGSSESRVERGSRRRRRGEPVRVGERTPL